MMLEAPDMGLVTAVIGVDISACPGQFLDLVPIIPVDVVNIDVRLPRDWFLIVVQMAIVTLMLGAAFVLTAFRIERSSGGCRIIGYWWRRVARRRWI